MKIRALIAAGSVIALAATASTLVPATAEPSGGPNVGPSPLSGVPGAMPQTNKTIFSLGYANNVLYLGGTFTEVRPTGAAPGTQTTPQARLAAVDTTTNQLISTWTPQVTGGDIFAVAVSPDKSRLYVGGTFTSINGSFRGRVAAFDITNPRNPVLLPAQFNVNGKVAALTATNDTVYVGGYFTSAKGIARSKLAAFSNTGTVLPWQPLVTGSPNTSIYPQPFVTALESDGAGSVAIGGMFDNVNGVFQHGLAKVDGVTGARSPGFTPPGMQPLSYVVTMDFAAGRLHYAGRDDKTGSQRRLEGVSTIDANTGQQIWGDDFHRCLGDTFAVLALHGQVWAGTHAHDCSDIGTYPEANPRFYGSVLGQNAGTGEQVHFYPSVFGNNVEQGSKNSVRAFETDGSRLFVAGGWLRVDGVNSQNLNSYSLKGATGGSAPTRVGTPTATTAAVGARVTWLSSKDIDDKFLTYRIFRGNASSPIGEITAASTFWNRPMLTFHDTTAPANQSVNYRVQVVDASNVVTKSVLSNSVTAGSPPDSYDEAVINDAPAFYWRFEETSGSSAADSSPNGNQGSLTGGDQNVGGAVGSGVALSGDLHAYESVNRSNPMPYSMELWFNSTSNAGGKLMGFGNSTTGVSTQYDRHVYMTNDGRLVFGAYPGGVQAVSSAGTYNDGAWHHVVATHGGSGMSLYVDGTLVGQNAVTSAEGYSGRFRVGGDNLNGWPDQPTSRGLDAQYDEAALYLRDLLSSEIQIHYEAR